MILYFTGTGNSEYVAERIGREANDEVINLFERLREKDFTEIHSERQIFRLHRPHDQYRWSNIYGPF